MSATLEKQLRLPGMIARLVLYAESLGYQLKYSYAKRCEGCEVGLPHSLHKIALAVDFDLFDRENNYLDKTEDHEPLGEYWEKMGGTWGGRWGDGNHYSIAHQGVK